MSKPFTVQHVMPLSLACLVVGAIMTVVGALALWKSYLGGLNSWGFWIALIGGIVLLVGIVWFGTYRANVKKFNKLMEEKSKAAFVKNLDDIEYLAWRLPLSYEDRLRAKKKDFGVK